MLPNLKQLYIFGNPDPTVDVDFCHQIIKMAMARNIKVCVSTSGVGGKTFYKELLKGIPSDVVDYISVSIDSVDEEKLSMLKGRPYPFKKAIEGIKWLLNSGYTVKIQPTLWSSNFEDVEEIMEYFISIGITWFSFHIGSLESGINLPTHHHLTCEEVRNVHLSIQRVVERHWDENIQVRCPVIYPELGGNDETKWYCMKETIGELLVTFTERGIKGTSVPMASLFKDDLSFYFEAGVDTIEIPSAEEAKTCPISMELSGRKGTICRYVSKYW
jgi:MoaA/NifB/PqqE/SkfB family radical SAM enzyme